MLGIRFFIWVLDSYATIDVVVPKITTHQLKVKSPLLTPTQTICLLGDTKHLRAWDAKDPILLSRKEGEDYFSVSLDLSKATFPISYKYGVYDVVKKSFVVFENGFVDNFLELAFVEVSSDGIHFFRFPANSETRDSIQIGTFGAVDATNINNLAGKYQVNYGSPFDLDEISNDSLLNKGNITHIKIIDVIGNITPEFANYDSQNRKINDPWPTPFPSSGFDLDALGLIHVNGINSIEEKKINIAIYPNPFTDKITLEIEDEITAIQLVSISGSTLSLGGNKSLNLSFLTNGVYFLKIYTKTNFYVQKVVKK